jgi:hypothetical protein
MMGLLNMAKQGRNGDTMMGHLTPGEVVVPKEFWSLAPDLMHDIMDRVASTGADPRKLIAGVGRKNPKTGLEEFATAEEVTKLYQDYLGRAPESQAMIDYHANSGQSLEQLTNNFISAPERSTYVSNLYNTNLGRAAESPGAIAYHVNSGQTAAQLAQTFQTSEERKLQESMGIVKAGETYNWSGSPVDSKQINSIYTDSFGRPAEDAGSQYWQEKSQGLLGQDYMTRVIRAGAQGDDTTALTDPTLPGYGVDRYNKAWDTSIDVNKDPLKYDPEKDKWVIGAKKPIPPQYTPAGNNYQPNLNQQVDPNSMTIEGRIQGLLSQNNPVLLQARNRALDAFAQRGLLNSSMAQEAAQEAMIAKAIEIAGPDAATYFEQSNLNQDWTNKFAQTQQNQQYNLQNMDVQQQYSRELKTLDQSFTEQNLDKQQAFTLRQNYLQSVGNYETQYNQAVLAIQGTEMAVEDKTAAIQSMTQQRDNNVFMTTQAFAAMPEWVSEWSQLSTGISNAPKGIDLAKGPTAHSRTQVYDAITYAASDPSYMTDAQFDQWSQAAVSMGLISQAEYDALK